MCKEHIKIKWRPTIFAEAKFKDRSKLLAKLNLRPYQARPILKPGKVLMYTLKMMIYFSIWEGEWKDLVFSLKPPPIPPPPRYWHNPFLGSVVRSICGIMDHFNETQNSRCLVLYSIDQT